MLSNINFIQNRATFVKEVILLEVINWLYISYFNYILHYINILPARSRLNDPHTNATTKKFVAGGIVANTKNLDHMFMCGSINYLASICIHLQTLLPWRFISPNLLNCCNNKWKDKRLDPEDCFDVGNCILIGCQQFSLQSYYSYLEELALIKHESKEIQFHNCK